MKGDAPTEQKRPLRVGVVEHDAVETGSAHPQLRRDERIADDASERARNARAAGLKAEL